MLAVISWQATSKEGESEDEFFLEIRVHDPAKVGEGMGAFVSYKVYPRTRYPTMGQK